MLPHIFTSSNLVIFAKNLDTFILYGLKKKKYELKFFNQLYLDLSDIFS